MANQIISLRGVAGRFPSAVEEAIRQGMMSATGDRGRIAFCGTPEGFLSIANSSNIWLTIPIIADLPEDSIEVLLRVVRITAGTESYSNSGGGICFASVKEAGLNEAYYGAFGSGGSSRYLSIYRRGATGSQTSLRSANGVAPNAGDVSLLRFRREGNSLKMKSWNEGEEEPAAWGVEATDSTYKCRHIFILTHGYKLSSLYTDIAVATNGDTASLEDSPVQTAYGVITREPRSRTVVVYDALNHIPVATSQSDSLGVWTAPIHTDRPVYANIEGAEGSYYDILFARGGGYFAGAYPSGVTSIEGVPAPAEIRVLLRMPGSLLDGAVVASTTSESDGTWRIMGLDTNMEFDVVCRHDGYNDMILSKVKPVKIPEEILHASGVIVPDSSHIGIIPLVTVHGGVAPFSVEVVSGLLPRGISLVMDGSSLVAQGKSMEYGDFSGQIRILDSNDLSANLDFQLSGIVAAMDVQFVGVGPTTFVNTAIMDVQAPSEVLEGDSMYAVIVTRSMPITPPIGWELVGSFDNIAYPQYGRLYKKIADVGDADKTFTWLVDGDVGRTMSTIFAVRGDRPVLAEVVEGSMETSDRTSPFPTPEAVAPRVGLAFGIHHQALAATGGSSTISVDADWTLITPSSSSDSENQLRMGVAYKPVEKDEVVSAIFTPNRSGSNAVGSATVIITCPPA